MLTSCSTTQTKVERVVVTKTKLITFPEAWLQDCPKTMWQGGTNRDVSALAIERGNDIDKCNLDKTKMRKLQQQEINKQRGDK